jgi:hypothetical protein
MIAGSAILSGAWSARLWGHGLGRTQGTADPLDGLRRLIEKEPDDGGVTGSERGLGLLDPLADLMGVAYGGLACSHAAEATESAGTGVGLMVARGRQPWEQLTRESFPSDVPTDADGVSVLVLAAGRPGVAWRGPVTTA